MTQYQAAINGNITPEMKKAAQAEGVSEKLVISEIAEGKAVLPCNPRHTTLAPCIVGRAFRTKINANIGRSPDRSDTGSELRKLQVALDAGAHCIMDLSVGDKLSSIRRSLLEQCPAAFGTVPIYEAVSRLNGQSSEITSGLLLDVIRTQAEEGVDFMTLHAGLLRKHVALAEKRLLGIVSRGGALLADWMVTHSKENPLYESWDAIMDICRKHDVTVSLGDGLRPGCIDDASDDAQFAELDTLGELVQACRGAGVQVMVEGPGHVPFNEIAMNMERQQQVCDGAPFYVLGPVVTDIAPGFDHITSSIGATAAAFHGASLLCYVTPAEHLALPCDEDVHTGVIAYRIAAHAADVARDLPGARARDRAISKARSEFNWETQFNLALDPVTARHRYESARNNSEENDYCSMCGKDFCAIRNSRNTQKKAKG